MSDRKLSQLAVGTVVNDGDLFYSAQPVGGGAYTQVQQSASQLRGYFGQGYSGHVHFGNAGGVDSVVSDPGDPGASGNVFDYPVVLNVNEAHSGAFGPTSALGDVTIYGSLRNTGAAKGSWYASLDVESFVRSDNTGPWEFLYGAYVFFNSLSQGTVDHLYGLFSQATWSGIGTLNAPLIGAYCYSEQNFGTTQGLQALRTGANLTGGTCPSVTQVYCDVLAGDGSTPLVIGMTVADQSQATAATLSYNLVSQSVGWPGPYRGKGGGNLFQGHVAIGNRADVDYVTLGVGDPANAAPFASPIVLSMNEFVSGDLSLNSLNDMAAIFSTWKHTGTAAPSVNGGIDCETQISSESTGPITYCTSGFFGTYYSGTGACSDIEGVSAWVEAALGSGATEIDGSTTITRNRKLGLTTNNGIWVGAWTSSTGSTTNQTGVYIAHSGDGSEGAVTNLRGIWIEDHSTSTATGVVLNLYSQGANSNNHFEGGVTTIGHTVAALASMKFVVAGTRSWVTNATQTFTSANFGTTVTGGGTNGVPVIFDGTNWKIG